MISCDTAIEQPVCIIEHQESEGFLGLAFPLSGLPTLMASIENALPYLFLSISWLRTCTERSSFSLCLEKYSEA